MGIENKRILTALNLVKKYGDYNPDDVLSAVPELLGFELNGRGYSPEHPTLAQGNIFAIHDRLCSQTSDTENYVYHPKKNVLVTPEYWRQRLWDAPKGSHHRLELLESHLVGERSFEAFLKEYEIFSREAEMQEFSHGIVIDSAHFSYALKYGFLSKEQVWGILEALPSDNVALHISACNGVIENPNGKWAKHQTLTSVSHKSEDKVQFWLVDLLLKKYPDAMITLEGPHENIQVLREEMAKLLAFLK